jgi:hypothetical protein
MMMIKFLIHLLVLTISSYLLLGLAIGGLYFVYGFIACSIFLIAVMLFLFGVVWLLEYGSEDWDIDKQDNK